jgi:hypothetical protein
MARTYPCTDQEFMGIRWAKKAETSAANLSPLSRDVDAEGIKRQIARLKEIRPL